MRIGTMTTLRFLFVLLKLIVFIAANEKSIPTFDEFFDYTTYSSLSFSPNKDILIYQTQYPSWDNNTFVYSLWIYDLNSKAKTLITDKASPSMKPQWSPNGDWIALSLFNKTQPQEQIHLYSLTTNELLSIRLENRIPLNYIWKDDDDYSLFVTTMVSPLVKKELDEEWKDVIRYRNDRSKQSYIIYELKLNPNKLSEIIKKNVIKQVSLPIAELVYASGLNKLIFNFVSQIRDNLDEFEIYSIDLDNVDSLSRLTHSEAREEDLKLSIDGKELFFRAFNVSSTKMKSTDSQVRLHSIDLTNGQIKRYAESFQGYIYGYTFTPDGTLYFTGQIGTELQIYSQSTINNSLIYHPGWNGTYEYLEVSKHNTFAFVHSSYKKSMEIYLTNRIDQLHDAEAITDRNQLFTQRNLPKVKVYQWKNQDDGQTIEGLLHYPPGKFEEKDLPLLVLIHGGPYYGSLNRFGPNSGDWASIAATQGWLVLEPNYRGSVGYGDEFMNQIRSRPLSLPGNDILFGVDQLIRDGIVDPYQLTVGGYSYGGLLTNWLITQTKRFNAALSGSGSVDHTSFWGTLDVPVLIENLFGGFPWTVPHIYQTESPIFQIDRVSTPTLIVTGQQDVRVPASQSYMLERALYYRGIPVELLIFPNEGHALIHDPWHDKIKVQEELKWLDKYGKRSN